MTYLLDTNTCIRFLNGASESVRRRVAAMGEKEIVLCSVVKAELFYGVQKSARPVQNREALRRFFRRFASLNFDDVAGEYYGEIRLSLERAGTPIGPNDLMIAAIALSRDLTLVTHNTNEFSRVSELQIEDWETAG